jgi:hypothetical protein
MEYQFSGTMSLTAGDVGQKGTHLVDPREFNQPLAPVGALANLPLQQRRRLYGVAPLITNISGTDSSAIMNYNSLQVSARKRLSGGLDFIASYTLSRTLTDNLGYYGSSGVAGEGAYWQNAYNRHGDYGPAFFDALHNFSFGGTYRLPYGHGRTFGNHANAVTNAILGGWKLDAVISVHSGFPVTITSRDVSNQLVRGSLRANRYGKMTYADQTIDHWFGIVGTDVILCQDPGATTDPASGKPCSYGVPAPNTFGTSSKGTEHAPNFKNLDASVGKHFHTTEKQYFDFRADFYNIFNHANFGPPARTMSTPTTFGQITSTIGLPRTIQFGLKYYF